MLPPSALRKAELNTSTAVRHSHGHKDIAAAGERPPITCEEGLEGSDYQPNPPFAGKTCFTGRAGAKQDGWGSSNERPLPPTAPLESKWRRWTYMLACQRDAN